MNESVVSICLLLLMLALKLPYFHFIKQSVLPLGKESSMLFSKAFISSGSFFVSRWEIIKWTWKTWVKVDLTLRGLYPMWLGCQNSKHTEHSSFHHTQVSPGLLHKPGNINEDREWLELSLGICQQLIYWPSGFQTLFGWMTILDVFLPSQRWFPNLSVPNFW